MANWRIFPLCLLTLCILQINPALSQSGFKIERLDHLVLSVRDVRKTVDFYAKVLGMEKGGDWGPVYYGKSKINIYAVRGGFLPKASAPTPGSADLCFITDTDVDQVIKHLKACNISILEGPVWRPGALGGITSVYFRDPDENLIEVSNYPST